MTVSLGFGEATAEHLPPGFGYLVPRKENRRMLACTFVHRKFDCRAPEGKALLRCFLGGSRDPQVLNLSDDEDGFSGVAGIERYPAIHFRPLLLASSPLADFHGAVPGGTRQARGEDSGPDCGPAGCLPRWKRLFGHWNFGLHSHGQNGGAESFGIAAQSLPTPNQVRIPLTSVVNSLKKIEGYLTPSAYSEAQIWG